MTEQPVKTAKWRESLREQTLRNALRKRAAGVPTLTVPEAAALLSISQEFLYRLIHADGFPSLRMRTVGSQGRFVVPTLAVERLLKAAADAGTCVESAALTAEWNQGMNGGVA